MRSLLVGWYMIRGNDAAAMAKRMVIYLAIMAGIEDGNGELLPWMGWAVGK